MIETVEEAYRTALHDVSTNISQFVRRPGIDFVRNRKLGVEKVLDYLVTNGGESSKDELLDLCSRMDKPPSVQAMIKQRAKLKPCGVRRLLLEFNRRAEEAAESQQRTFMPAAAVSCSAEDAAVLASRVWEAVDGSAFAFDSDHRYAGEEYYSQSRPDQRGTYSMLLTAMYDLSRRTYTDGIIQPLHQMDERDALCTFVDARAASGTGRDTVIVADRGYASYNVLAHMMEADQPFVIRFPDVTAAGGMLHHLGLPETGTWDLDVDIELTRSKSKRIVPQAPLLRVLNRESTFDYLPLRSQSTYRMKFRVVRIDIDGNGTYECLVTNLPAEEFPPRILRIIYEMRWGIETSFRDLKYTIGAIHFHAARPQLVEQEIWGAMIGYNFTELMAQEAAAQRPRNDKDHFVYRANFSRCAHIVKRLLRADGTYSYEGALLSMQREMVAIRPGRHYVRDMDKRKRRRSFFTYRSA